MLLLVFTFASLFLLVFVLLAFASKPSKHQKVVQMRLGQLGLGDKEEEEEEIEKTEEILKQTPDNAFSAFEHLFSRFKFYVSLQELIERAGSKSTPDKIIATSLGLGVVSFFAVSLLIPALALKIGIAVIATTAPVLFLRFKRARRLKAFNEVLPDAIDMMSRALRAGHSVASAIEVVAEQAREPVASEFERVYQQQNFGLPFRDALTTLANRIDSKDLQIVVTAMLVQKETGGNLAEILDRTAYVIRERIRIYGEVRIKSAQGRMTGWVLSLLPVVLGFLINFINHGFEKPLLEEPIGHVMLYTGAAMLTLGALIIRKIVNIEV